jgi:hypothetical protein
MPTLAVAPLLFHLALAFVSLSDGQTPITPFVSDDSGNRFAQGPEVSWNDGGPPSNVATLYIDMSTRYMLVQKNLSAY